MSDYKVTTVSPEEVAEVMARLRRGGPENRNDRRTAILAGGIEMKGSFEITAREVGSGEVAWAHKAENLITDFGRRAWMDQRFYALAIGFGASTETPSASRSSLCGEATQFFNSSNLTPTNNSVTHTKTMSASPLNSASFGTPANNRTLGTIWIQRHNQGIPNGVSRDILAYALLTPPKTQTTTQTLEVVYKISMSPIY